MTPAYARIEINDHDTNGVLTFDLDAILTALPESIRRFRWFILEWQAEGLGRRIVSMRDFEKSVNDAPLSLPITWAELVALARDTRQTYDATIVALDDPADDLPAFPLTLAGYERFTIIEAIDNSVWVITSDIPEVIPAISRAFHDVRTIR